MQLYTSPDFVGYHPNFPVTGSHPTGGMSTKMAAVEIALGCQTVTDLKALPKDTASADLIVEPLAIKAPRNVPEELEHGGDWQKLRDIERGRIAEVANYPGRKILLCSEMEILRWPGAMRREVVKAVEAKVFASCYYQQALMSAVGIQSDVIYEPINEYLYYPGVKRYRQVVAIGSVKHIKNIEMVIEVFRKLEGTDFHRVYIGSPNVWGGKVHRQREAERDMELYDALLDVCDEHHDASPGTFIARVLAEAEFYLNFAYHEVCCRTAMEALMAGCGVIGGPHPLWKEYPALAQVESADACLAVLEKHTGDESIAENMRAWAVKNFGFARFQKHIQGVFEN